MIILLIVGFFYSSPYFRFKEKFIIDILFGASLTFLFRFVASWFIFKISFPPLLPMLALICLKNGGFMLYKGYDRPFLIKSKVRNSITRLSQKTIFITSAVFFSLSIILFVLLCLNYKYIHVNLFGYLPTNFLLLLILFIPPIVIQYLLFFKKINISARYMRVAGFVSLFLMIVVILLALR